VFFFWRHGLFLCLYHWGFHPQTRPLSFYSERKGEKPLDPKFDSATNKVAVSLNQKVSTVGIPPHLWTGPNSTGLEAAKRFQFGIIHSTNRNTEG